jgi:hypothetical protein
VGVIYHAIEVIKSALSVCRNTMVYCAVRVSASALAAW